MTDEPTRRRVLRVPVGALVHLDGIQERIKAVRRNSVELEIEAPREIDIAVELPVGGDAGDGD